MTRCSHCGKEHAPEVKRCPLTNDLVERPGPIGTSVDRYQLELLLGTGTFGSVYRAKHADTGQLVALKTLKRQLAQDAKMVERYFAEARAASALGSENIVRILDAGRTPNGLAFVAMELLEGSDLKELAARSGPLSPRRVVDLLGQVLDALDAAHQKDIVHRDLKPANVFVAHRDGKDAVKLLDFGISKMQESSSEAALTMTGMGMGTPGYMSPEQFFEAKSVDARVDVYSAGAMAYELFTGRLPIEARSYTDMILKVNTEVVPPLGSLVPSLPAAVAAAVDKALAREPKDRWSTARELAQALRAVPELSDVPAPVVAAPPAAAGGRSSRRPAQAGASALQGATSPPAGPPRPPAASSAPPSVVVQLEPQPAPPPPAPARPLMPPPQPQPQKKSNPVFWAIVILGGLAVLGGGCWALKVASALNEAGGGDTHAE